MQITTSRDFIAIFGGSFDPPHLAHREIIKLLCEIKECLHIIILPTYMNPLKAKPLFSATSRVQMCEIIARELNDMYKPADSITHTALPRVIVSDYEIRQNQPIFSVQSIAAVQDSMRVYYPQIQYAFALGSDCFIQIPKWKEPERLCQMVDFIIIERALSEQQNHAKIDAIKYQKNLFAESLKNDNSLHSSLQVRILTHLVLPHFHHVSSSKVRFLLFDNQLEKALKMLPSSIHHIITALSL